MGLGQGRGLGKMEGRGEVLKYILGLSRSV